MAKTSASAAGKRTGRKGASAAKSARHRRGSSSKNRGKVRKKSASASVKGRKKITMASVRKAVTRTMQRVRAEGPGQARKFIRQAKETATRVADSTVKVVATTAGVVSEMVHPTERQKNR